MPGHGSSNVLLCKTVAACCLKIACLKQAERADSSSCREALTMLRCLLPSLQTASKLSSSYCSHQLPACEARASLLSWTAADMKLSVLPLHPLCSCIHATKLACQALFCPGSNCPHLSNQYAGDSLRFARGCGADDHGDHSPVERSDPKCDEHPHEGLWG